jgi:hypothetical protein
MISLPEFSGRGRENQLMNACFIALFPQFIIGVRPEFLTYWQTEAVAAQQGFSPERLTDVARSRHLTKTRTLLVYLARHWSGATSKELGLRLKRDASMISKLYSKYTEQRDLGAEGRIRRLLNNKSITQV